MSSEFEMSEQPKPRPTRRTVVATGVKLAYMTPIVAASFKVRAVNALAAVSGAFCGHSTGTNGGCMPACTSAGFTGKQCGVICGTGQSDGACPVGQGGDNPCCNPGYCEPANFRKSNTNPGYTGPTTGCPTATKGPATSAAPLAPKGPAASAAGPAPKAPKKKGKKKKGKK